MMDCERVKEELTEMIVNEESEEIIAALIEYARLLINDRK